MRGQRVGRGKQGEGMKVTAERAKQIAERAIDGERLTPMNTFSFARKIAHEEGIKPATNKLLEVVIWEQTGYPCFWPTGNAEAVFTKQLREAFRKMKEAQDAAPKPLKAMKGDTSG